MSDSIWPATSKHLGEHGYPALDMTDDELARHHPPSPPHTYLILEYTEVFFKPKFCSKSSEAIFNSAIEKCPYSNCVYSCAKEADLKRADLLIFHLRDLEAEYEKHYRPRFDDWLRNTKQLPFKTVDEKRNNNDKQLWLLWNDESTPIDVNFNKLSPLFNWTMSFKTNSEVFEGSYGFLTQHVDLSYGVVSKLKKSLFYDDFLGRRNAILWFVSNCKSKHRIQVALELSKHYPVFIYGKCNVLDASLTPAEAKSLYPYLNSMGENERSMEDFAHIDCKEDTNCDERKYRTFKYYLAFENRNCTDYITEKVWRTLDKGIVPIVLQPSRESYVRYEIPDESYIHMEDFDHDPKRLAQHLKLVDRDFGLYYNYRKWTSVYNRIEWRADYLEPHRMCQLCRLLNTFNRTISYNNIGNFFNNRCHDK